MTSLPQQMKENREKFDSKFPSMSFDEDGTSRIWVNPYPRPDDVRAHLDTLTASTYHNAQEEMLERVRASLSGTLEHPEFCKKRGEQFKECAKCFIERALSSLRAGESTKP